MKFIFTFLFFINLSFADNLMFYDMNGNEISPSNKARSINEFVKENFANVKYYYNPSNIKYSSINVENGYILAVYYYGFSNRPFFVLGKNPKKLNIDYALSLYSFDKFFNTYNFSYEFTNVINSKNFIIDDAYIHLGKPESESSSNDITILYYYDRRLLLIFNKNILINFNINN